MFSKNVKIINTYKITKNENNAQVSCLSCSINIRMNQFIRQQNQNKFKLETLTSLCNTIIRRCEDRICVKSFRRKEEHFSKTFKMAALHSETILTQSQQTKEALLICIWRKRCYAFFFKKQQIKLHHVIVIHQSSLEEKIIPLNTRSAIQPLIHIFVLVPLRFLERH